MIVLSVKTGTTQKLEKTILEENGCHIHRKKMPFFVTFAFFFCRGNKEQTFTKIGYRDWKKAVESLQRTKNLIVILTQQLIFIIFVSTFPSMNNFLTKPQRRRRQGNRRLERIEK